MLLPERLKRPSVDRIYLVECEQDRRLRLTWYLRGVVERFGVAAVGRLDEVDDNIGVLEGAERGRAHGALEVVGGGEESGGVEEDHLDVAFGPDADDAIACGLGLGGGDGEFLSDEAIEQRGFSHVVCADDGDDACFGHRGLGGTGKNEDPQSITPWGSSHESRRRPTLP